MIINRCNNHTSASTSANANASVSGFRCGLLCSVRYRIPPTWNPIGENYFVSTRSLPCAWCRDGAQSAHSQGHTEYSVV